ncbi:preprotein translocase subunit SecG [Amorphus sp. 3PC139-8]|uniref:preprotein translocase subunit SecG n=1 Tax=Amorphus sp. 3PC139-8 TaxID=2735676 RepID=UPI00345C8678
METVLIVIHLMVVIALVAVILLQRSEGGALGIGGGGGFMSARGTGNALTKATAVFAFVFFATSIGLTILARQQETPSSILDDLNQPGGEQQQGVPRDAATRGSGEGILDTLKGLGTGGDQSSNGASAPTAPTSQPATQQPAAPSAPAAPGGPQVPTSE